MITTFPFTVFLLYVGQSSKYLIYIYLIYYSLKQFGTLSSPILQMSLLRLKEGKKFAQGYKLLNDRAKSQTRFAYSKISLLLTIMLYLLVNKTEKMLMKTLCG